MICWSSTTGMPPPCSEMRQTAEQLLRLDPDDRVRLAQRRTLNRQLQDDHDLPYLKSA
jgi:hypothetical protein